ncbi:hypothetical protein Slin14017_G068460 [Septoria linicola]|nr:hypothetical protein Slin14017_G068460 [Septoria linicola]
MPSDGYYGGHKPQEVDEAWGFEVTRMRCERLKSALRMKEDNFSAKIDQNFQDHDEQIAAIWPWYARRRPFRQFREELKRAWST